VRATGMIDKLESAAEPIAESDASAALKGERVIYIPEERGTRRVPVYDGHRTRHGNRITGPAVIEQVNTTVLLTASNDCFCDRYGSFVVYRKGREECVAHALEETTV